jgi:hypothetical protein
MFILSDIGTSSKAAIGIILCGSDSSNYLIQKLFQTGNYTKNLKIPKFLEYIASLSSDKIYLTQQKFITFIR